MGISVRNTRSPPQSQSPSQLTFTNSILIQTDDGRRFDSSILHNLIIDDPFPQKTKSSLRPLLCGLIIIAVFAYLLISENMGFSSFPLAVTDRKYLGRMPNVGSKSSSGNNSTDALKLVEDVDDEFGGTEDDDAQYIDANNATLENNEDGQSSDSYDEVRGTDDNDAHDNENDATFENKQFNDSNDEWRGKTDGDAQDTDDYASFENKEDSQFNESNYELRGTEDDDTQDTDVDATFDNKGGSQFRDSNYELRASKDNDAQDIADGFFDNELVIENGNTDFDANVNFENEERNHNIGIDTMDNEGELDKELPVLRDSHLPMEEDADAFLIEYGNNLTFTNFENEESNHSTGIDNMNNEGELYKEILVPSDNNLPMEEDSDAVLIEDENNFTFTNSNNGTDDDEDDGSSSRGWRRWWPW